MSEKPKCAARTIDCDVLVIGAGVSGYCAAIQAGRGRAQTVLLEKDAVIGGNSGPNLGVGITGADRFNAYATETGIIQEIHETGSWVRGFTPVSPGTMPYNISRRFEAVVQQYLEEAGVTVLKRHYARKPRMDGARITGVIAEDLASFQTVQINVRHIVVEASGDGEIGALAGADFDTGSEARAEFSERSAPEERTGLVQGSSLVAIAYRAEYEVPFQPPPGTPSFFPRVWQGSLSSVLRHHDGFYRPDRSLIFLYVTEAGGDMDTVRDDGEIYERLLGQLWAEWDHIKNGPHREQTRNWDLLWVSPKAGKRESRRFLGDFVLTQTDLEEGRIFSDDVAYGGHDFDDHKPLKGHSNIYTLSVPPLYGIPFRCCYSRNIENLLLAGRLISASHLAHSSTRVMRTGAAIGQAVGMAAGLCVEHGCSPRELYQSRISVLQSRLLLNDATLLSRPVPGAQDLALAAAASASSELRFNEQVPGTLVPLLAPAGNLLWDWPASLDAIELYLHNESDHEETLDLAIFRADRERKWKTMDEYQAQKRNDLRDESFQKLTSLPLSVPPNFCGWHRVELPQPFEAGAKDPTSDDDRLLIAFATARPEVSWAVTQRPYEIAEMVEHRHHSPTWSSLGRMGAMRLFPPPPLGEATNLLDGFHRRFSRAPIHAWISDPDHGLPQELSLTWPKEVTFDEINLVFDNLPQARHDNPWECGKRTVDFCVKSYAVDFASGGRWSNLLREEDNYHRFRAHRFVPVTAEAIRLRVFDTHGGRAPARVFQIRVYHHNSDSPRTGQAE